MAASEQIALEPALAAMLAEDFHHAAGLREVLVHRQCGGHPLLAGSGDHVLEAITGRLIGAKDAEVFLRLVGFHNAVQQLPQNARRFHVFLSAPFNLHRKLAEVGHLERLQQQSAVGMRVHAHATAAFGRNLRQLRAEGALLVEEFLGLVALHPLFQQAQVIGLLANLAEWNLMRAPGIFDGLAVNKFRPGPSFGRTHDEHGPCGALDGALCSREPLFGFRRCGRRFCQRPRRPAGAWSAGHRLRG